jgi:hypothetical protein
MYLFLDIDGVLHPFPSDEYFRPENCSVLERLLDRYPDIQVIISSSWRNYHPLEQLKSFMPAKIAQKIIDATKLENSAHTGSYSRQGLRERQIQEWMQENAPEGKWFAIDDTLELYSEGAPLFYPNECEGLQEIDLAGIEQLVAEVEATPLRLIQERREKVLNYQSVPENNLLLSPGFTCG